jgi:arylsulfatase A-like enzyme
VKPGVSDELLCHIDMIGSFAKLLNVKLPPGAAPDSENHLKAWLNMERLGRQVLVLQNGNNNLSIENGTWKYIAPGTGAPFDASTNTELGNLNQDQLYDLSNDPEEKVNLAEKNQPTVKILRSKLNKIREAK